MIVFYSIPGYVHRYPSLTNSKDPREINDEFEEARRTWKECDACDMHIPQRTYHCSLCNACISIPDHHCYFLGKIMYFTITLYKVNILYNKYLIRLCLVIQKLFPKWILVVILKRYLFPVVVKKLWSDQWTMKDAIRRQAIEPQK